MIPFGETFVPWNAAWSFEMERQRIDQCRWAGELAVVAPHAPGVGKPMFATPHPVRQRRSIRQYLCTVCGLQTYPSNRWWFALGQIIDQVPAPFVGTVAGIRGNFATTEAPVHECCAELALEHCPHLRKMDARMTRWPGAEMVLTAIVGGHKFEQDFPALKVNGRRVVGALKFAWPLARLPAEVRANMRIVRM